MDFQQVPGEEGEEEGNTVLGHASNMHSTVVPNITHHTTLHAVQYIHRAAASLLFSPLLFDLRTRLSHPDGVVHVAGHRRHVLRELHQRRVERIPFHHLGPVTMKEERRRRVVTYISRAQSGPLNSHLEVPSSDIECTKIDTESKHRGLPSASLTRAACIVARAAPEV